MPQECDSAFQLSSYSAASILRECSGEAEYDFSHYETHFGIIGGGTLSFDGNCLFFIIIIILSLLFYGSLPACLSTLATGVCTTNNREEFGRRGFFEIFIRTSLIKFDAMMHDRGSSFVTLSLIAWTKTLQGRISIA